MEALFWQFRKEKSMHKNPAHIERDLDSVKEILFIQQQDQHQHREKRSLEF